MRSLLHIVAVIMILSALALGSTACGDDSCYDNGSSLPLATFYRGGTPQTINGLTIKGIGVPGDSLLADSISLSEAYLPLRATTTSTSYALSRWIATDAGQLCIRDTLTIDYQPIEYFHTVECGAMFNFEVNQVRHTTHGIDSVILVNDLITNAAVPSIRIYFAQ